MPADLRGVLCEREGVGSFQFGVVNAHWDDLVFVPHGLLRRRPNVVVLLPVITTQPFEETWIDFIRAWPRVKFPKGTEPIGLVFGIAKAADPPAVAGQYEQAELRLLVTLCRELQRIAGDGPFYLDCRTGARLLHVDHTTVWRWMSVLLVADGVLEIVARGSRTSRKATRYRSLLEL